MPPWWRRGPFLCGAIVAALAVLWAGGELVLNVLIAVTSVFCLGALLLYVWIRQVPNLAAPSVSMPEDVHRLRAELEEAMRTRGTRLMEEDKATNLADSERQRRTPPVNQRFTVMVDRFCKEYIDYWYKSLSDGDVLFLEAMKARLWVVINRLQERFQRIDMVNLLTQDLVNILTNHLRAIQLYPRESFPSHPCLISPVAEMTYLRRASEALVRILLPESDLRSVALRSLLRELVLRYVLKPTVDMWSDPDVLNQTIIINIEYFTRVDHKVERSYAYAETYSGFVKIINACQDINTLRDIRYHVITEIIQAKQILEMQIALKQGRADKLTFAMITDNPKAAQLKSRNLERYINQCAYAKNLCEKRILLLGGSVFDSSAPSSASGASSSIVSPPPNAGMGRAGSVGSIPNSAQATLPLASPSGPAGSGAIGGNGSSNNSGGYSNYSSSSIGIVGGGLAAPVSSPSMTSSSLPMTTATMLMMSTTSSSGLNAANPGSVVEILNDGLALGYFAEFLREKHALANLHFWLSCSNLRQELEAQGHLAATWRSSLQEMFRVAQAPHSNLQIQDKTLRELLALSERLHLSFPAPKSPRGSGGELEGFQNENSPELLLATDIVPFLQAGDEVLAFFQQLYTPFLLSDCYRKYVRHAYSSAERNPAPKAPGHHRSKSDSLSPKISPKSAKGAAEDLQVPQTPLGTMTPRTQSASRLPDAPQPGSEQTLTAVGSSSHPAPQRSASFSSRMFGRFSLRRRESGTSLATAKQAQEGSSPPPASLGHLERSPAVTVEGSSASRLAQSSSPVSLSLSPERDAPAPLSLSRSLPSSAATSAAAVASRPSLFTPRLEKEEEEEGEERGEQRRRRQQQQQQQQQQQWQQQQRPLTTSVLESSLASRQDGARGGGGIFSAGWDSAPMSPISSPSLGLSGDEADTYNRGFAVVGSGASSVLAGEELDEFHDAEVGAQVELIVDRDAEGGELPPSVGVREGTTRDHPLGTTTAPVSSLLTRGAEESSTAISSSGPEDSPVHPLLRSKLDELSQDIRQKMRDLQAVSGNQEERVLLAREIQALESEHEALQRHYESIQEWYDSLDAWQVDVQNVIASPLSNKEDKGYSELLYGLLVHRENRLQDGEVSRYGWVVYRKHSELLALHEQVREIVSSVAKEPRCMSRAWMRFKPKPKAAAADADLEKQKAAAQTYFSLILEDERLRASQTLCSFLSRSPEHLRQRQDQAAHARNAKAMPKAVVAKPAAKRESASMGQRGAPAPGAATASDVNGVDGSEFAEAESADVGPSAAAQIPQAIQRELEEEVLDEEGREARDSIARPMYAFISEVFALRGVLTWLRRQLVTFVQLTYGSTINKSIMEMVEWLFYEPQLLYYQRILQDNLFPENWTPPPPRTLAQKVATREEARQKMLDNIPDMLVTLVGQTHCRKGVVRLHDALQNTHINKHLVYTLLEVLLVTACPEFGERDLARATVEMNAGDDWNGEAKQ